MTTEGDDGAAGVRGRFVELVRLRPGMYVGDVRDPEALAFVARGLLYRVEDRHRDGLCTRAEVALDGTGRVALTADAPLFALDPDPGPLEAAFTDIRKDEPVDLPTQGIDQSAYAEPVACALADALVVEVHDGALAWRVALRRGDVVEPARCVGASSRRETLVVFEPDLAILRHDPETLSRALAEALDVFSARSPALTLTLRTPGGVFAMRSPEGLSDRIARRAPDAPPLTPAARARREVDGLRVEVALRWFRDRETSAEVFAGRLGPLREGAPLAGARRAIHAWLREAGVAPTDGGLRLAVRVDGPTVRFSSQRNRVLGDGLEAAARQATEDALAPLGRVPDALHAWLSLVLRPTTRR